MAKIRILIYHYIREFTVSVKAFARENRFEFFLLLLLLLAAAVLRLYRIGEYMTFLGDEGRDALIVRRLLVFGDPILIGPGTSIGNMYLGPLYYYMMAPALFLANYSPIGPSVQVAVLAVVTVLFVWYIITKLFGRKLAFLFAFLFAISPTAIIFSRSSWNPNIMPFFSLLFVWSLWKVWYQKKIQWLLMAAISFACALQSHYLALLMAPLALVYLIKSFINLKSESERRNFYKKLFIAGILFCLIMSPLVLFDLRHDFLNFRAMAKFVSHRDGSFKGINEAIVGAGNVYVNVFTRLIAGRSEVWGRVTAAFVSLALSYLTLRKKLSRNTLFFFLWVVFGAFGLAFVQREIYDHYIGFLFAAPYLLIASAIYDLKSIIPRFSYHILLALILAGFTVLNISESPLKYNPSRQMQRSIAVSKKVLEAAEGKPFNLAVLATTNYEDGYRYFLEVYGGEVLHADRWDPSTIADTLFVICEMPKDECKPNTDPKPEVANFGASQVDFEWEVSGVTIYKLSHKDLHY